MFIRLLLFVSSAIVLVVGALHLSSTFLGSDLEPRDPALEARMKEVSPNVTDQSTMWKGWIGFNAGYGLGLVLFGALYGYLSLFHFQTLRQSWFLLAAGAVFLGGQVVLAQRYMFSIPITIFASALVLYLAGVVTAVAQPVFGGSR